MALTLLESAKGSSDTLRAGVIMTMVETVPMLRKLPWETIDGNAYTYRSEVALPGIAFRAVGDTWPASTHATTRNTERLAIMGGEVKIDRFELSTQGNKADLKAEAYEAKSRALGMAFSEAFFEGDSSVNIKSFDGIRPRISGNQVIVAGANGAALTLDMLDQGIDALIGAGEGAEVYINKTLRRKITTLGRNTAGHALIDTADDDAFGHQVVKYNGVPFRIIEREDDESTFLDFDETQGSSNVTASIYLVRFGKNYLFGIKGRGGDMEVKDFGELEAAPQHMGRIEFYCGLVLVKRRAAIRIKGITNA